MPFDPKPKQGGAGFNSYAAGKKTYGAGGRPAPNLGPTANKVGYGKRDAAAATRRNAFLNRQKGL